MQFWRWLSLTSFSFARTWSIKTWEAFSIDFRSVQSLNYVMSSWAAAIWVAYSIHKWSMLPFHDSFDRFENILHIEFWIAAQWRYFKRFQIGFGSWLRLELLYLWCFWAASSTGMLKLQWLFCRHLGGPLIGTGFEWVHYFEMEFFLCISC